MKFIKSYWDTTLLLILTWCILNEDFSLSTLVSGFIAGLVTVALVRLLFSNNEDIKNYRIRPYLFLWFIAALFYHIIRSGLVTIRAIYSHETNPIVVDLHTRVHNHWFQCLIANAITLTPGTVTIDKTDHKLKVLWLYPTTDDQKEQERIIFGSFEHILKKGDYRR